MPVATTNRTLPGVHRTNRILLSFIGSTPYLAIHSLFDRVQNRAEADWRPVPEMRSHSLQSDQPGIGVTLLRRGCRWRPRYKLQAEPLPLAERTRRNCG